ncbi:hydrophobin 1 [Collybia nuda]|uniref:Hydrophobin n=1 Tax=Collybia nuda TaxID=64659 RepID=A0A9P6CJ99_9AGAR|nr:hydrophobin 1 [Collybia nuda]KAF9468232.1 hydrophobin 1 [Collybia nuda]
MFSKVAILATLSVALSVAATPSGNEFECTTGPIYCCNSLEQSQSAAGTKILAGVGIAAKDVTGLVGQNCSPTTIVGTGKGANCAQKPVCCEENKDNGAVVIGCSPIEAIL